MSFFKKPIVLVVTSVIVTVLVVYLSPLKNLNIVEPTIREIDPKTFYEDYQINKDKYLFIDVRSALSYNTLHAASSTNIELYQMYNERHVLPKHGKTIVLICSGGLASGVAYGYLEHFGFLNLRRIKGGIENWQEEGLPVIKASTSTP